MFIKCTALSEKCGSQRDGPLVRALFEPRKLRNAEETLVFSFRTGKLKNELENAAPGDESAGVSCFIEITRNA